MASLGEIRAVTGDMIAATAGMRKAANEVTDGFSQMQVINDMLTSNWQNDGVPIGGAGRLALNAVAEAVAAGVAREAGLVLSATESLADTDAAIAAGM